MAKTDDENGSSEALAEGWAALDAGDIAGARRAAKGAGEEDPEALLLLAGCCREAGEDGEAMELLRRAIALDPEWPSPELWLAELLAAEEETVPEALKHASRALDLAEEEPEYLAALALKAGLQAELGNVDGARETLAELPPPEVALGDADAALEISDLHLALGDAELARDRLRTLTAAEPESAEAWHALGCAAAELGDEPDMRAAWKRTWALDSAPRGDRAVAEGPGLSEQTIAEIAGEALVELPARAQELMRGVPIVIADRPAEADVEAGVDPRVVGLFSGTAYPDNSHLGGQPGLTQILLFRRNLERLTQDEDDLREEIRVTLLHEAGHFFGLDDAELEERGLG